MSATAASWFYRTPEKEPYLLSERVNGTFWEAHSLLLTGRERFSLEDLIPVAERLELDPEEARSGLNERRFRERVEEDVEGGRRAGVHGTPTFFINGERLEAHWRQLAQLVPAKLTASKA